MNLTETKTRLRETNSLDVATAWLREQSDELGSYQAEDILEDARLDKVQLWAVVPGWQTKGEIEWLRRDKVTVDAAKESYTYVTSAANNFFASDGRIKVNAEMAKRLLDHGECSLDCVRMPIIDCSNGGVPLSDSWLQAVCDGRLIKVEHIRVSRSQLHSLVKAFDTVTINPAKKAPSIGVPTAKILSAPWQFPPGFTYEMLEGALKEKRGWISNGNALLSRGSRGKQSATWNPAKVAIRLHETKYFSLSGLTRVINDCFDSYIAEWSAYKENFL